MTTVPAAFGGRSVVSSAGSGAWSASTSAGAAVGAYEIGVTQLAFAARLLGGGDLSGPLSSSADVSGVTLATLRGSLPVTAGTFTVNGKQVTVATTDTLQAVFTAISTATSGAVSVAGTLAVGNGVVDDAVDVRLRQETEKINPARGDIGVGRERDHRHATGACRLADRADRMCEQRTDDDLDVFRQRLLRRELRAGRGAAVIDFGNRNSTGCPPWNCVCSLVTRSPCRVTTRTS